MDASSYEWNFYSVTKSAFLLQWTAAHTTGLVGQIALQDADAVKTILSQQKLASGNGQIYFVLSKDGKTVNYNLSLSDLCASNASHFADLTNGAKCDQINP